MKISGYRTAFYFVSFLACGVLAPKADARDCVCHCYINGREEYLDNVCETHEEVHRNATTCTAGPSGNLPLMYCRHWSGGIFGLVWKSCTEHGATGAGDWMTWNAKTKRWIGSANTEFACNWADSTAKANSSRRSDEQLVRAPEGRPHVAPLEAPRSEADVHL